MNYQIGIKFLFTGISLIILSFCANTAAFASDYQYKILDPKYNPDAQRVVDGELPPVQEVEPYESSSYGNICPNSFSYVFYVTGCQNF